MMRMEAKSNSGAHVVVKDGVTGPSDKVVTMTMFEPETEVPLVEVQYDAAAGKVVVIFNGVYFEPNAEVERNMFDVVSAVRATVKHE